MTSRVRGLSVADMVPFDEVVTCPPIVQEVLQGARDERAFRSVRDSLLALPMLDDPMPSELFLEAAQIYRTGRRQGYTIRSSADCLIAACAIRNAVPLLHNDHDFAILAAFTTLDARNALQ